MDKNKDKRNFLDEEKEIEKLLSEFESENIKIPDVTNLTVEQAEKALTNVGFKVANETIKEYNDTYDEGKVFGTDPEIGRTRPKGTTITLMESLGKNDTYNIEEYTGYNNIEVQTTLEKLY